MARQNRSSRNAAFIDAFQQLEARALLSTFPSLALLEAPTNPVVRMQTNRGDIDIEMLANVAPRTVDNFLGYLRRGELDNSFFHRLVPGFVLQGGGFRFDTSGGLGLVTPGPWIQNEFSRSNTQWTMSMAKLGQTLPGQPPAPDSATSQFFINLANNAANLDNQNGGFTVFARILDNASRTVLTTIAGLNRQNLSGRTEMQRPLPEYNPQGQPTGQSRSNASAFNEVPLNAALSGGLTSNNFVNIINIEIIKPAGATKFFDNEVAYAEGFAGSTINEFLPIVNLANDTAYYQVIVRYEKQGDTDIREREKVIASGTIGPRARGGITIFQFNDAANGLVPQGRPYAIIVQSTDEVTATLSHYDFGTATGEQFSSTPATSWGFGQARQAAGVSSFLLWYNTTASDSTVTATFYFEDGVSSRSTTVNTPAFRRGGLALAEIDWIPAGNFSIVLTSSQPVVAALTQYDNSNAAQPDGFTALGQGGAPNRNNVVTQINAGANTSHSIGFINPGSVAAIVSNIRYIFSDGRPDREIVPLIIIAPGSRASLDPFEARFGLDRTDNVKFTALITTNTEVYAHSIHRGLGDEVATPAANLAATRWAFAEGFMDPNRAGTNVLEWLTIFNASSPGLGTDSGAKPATVTINYIYTDGFTLSQQITIDPLKQFTNPIHTFQNVLNEGRNNNRFFFSIEVIADVPVVAEFWHFDLTLGGVSPSGGFSTLGTPISGIVRFGSITG